MLPEATAADEAAPPASLRAPLAPSAVPPLPAEACAPRATRLAAAGARAAAQAALPRLFQLPWPALRRIVLALPPAQRVAIAAVCKPLAAAAKHPEGAPPARYARRARNAAPSAFPAPELTFCAAPCSG
jgi:hypothetical protein